MLPDDHLLQLPHVIRALFLASRATRAYLGRISDALASFPAELVEDQTLALPTHPQVGPLPTIAAPCAPDWLRL